MDGTCPQAVEEYEAIRLELLLFNPELAKKPFVVAYNKMDTQEAADQWPSFQEALEKKGVKAFCMSAATQQGTMPVVWAAFELLQSQKKASLEGLISSFSFFCQFSADPTPRESLFMLHLIITYIINCPLTYLLTDSDHTFVNRNGDSLSQSFVTLPIYVVQCKI